MFEQNLLTGALGVEHRAAGIYLTDDEDFVYLMKSGDNLPKAIFNARTVTFADLRHEADQILNWAKSGITFERADSLVAGEMRKE